ncbi:cytochrome c biogenesis protein ResB [Marininema halotolerans]|uniref:Cytochrome c biogenesis protein n=1 Tax=Marininema halotolerans TaxID=1155944 RepID=A0A1I6TRE0_9BACL|nr:cytochrome c biogenesis protein ResB [Marininema halotolerans]SFS91823.1 cytochrome c biogenesis protein [Marininema halotolerans]
MENTKCECGHSNPVGTTLCEYCGKPLEEESASGQPLEMRYDGKARRSQTKNATWVDHVWNFFSSVKVAIWLILITLIISALGTIFPQERVIPSGNPDVYYKQKYGTLGDLYYNLGLSDVFNSPVFMILLGMIGISLVVCSLDRVIPLYKALNNQKIEKNPAFLTRQRVSRTESVSEADRGEVLKALSQALQKKRYHVRTEGESLLAEKGRISRWGPYINHIGLIIFLGGILLRILVPGWYLDESVFVREGETKKLPEVNYYLKNEKATMELYDQTDSREQASKGQPLVKKYETKAIVYQKDPNTGKLKEVKRGPIVVNHPLKVGDILLYQADFEANQTQAIQLQLTDKKTKEDLGKFRINLYDPAKEYALDKGIKVRILNYFPDFVMEGNRPTTKSENPNRPAFVFEVMGPKLKKSEKSWMIAGTNLDDISKSNRYAIDLSRLETVNTSGLMVRIDKSLPIIFTGLGIFMVGLSMGFFWYHRRVWIRIQDGTLYVGAHTNKNWFGLRRELEQATQAAGLPLSFSPEQRREE